MRAREPLGAYVWIHGGQGVDAQRAGPRGAHVGEADGWTACSARLSALGAAQRSAGNCALRHAAQRRPRERARRARARAVARQCRDKRLVRLGEAVLGGRAAKAGRQASKRKRSGAACAASATLRARHGGSRRRRPAARQRRPERWQACRQKRGVAQPSGELSGQDEAPPGTEAPQRPWRRACVSGGAACAPSAQKTPHIRSPESALIQTAD